MIRNQKAPELMEANDTDEGSNYRVTVGAFLIVFYGVAIVFAGFLIASVVFLFVWMLIGGVRKPFTLLTVSILGTIAPMYLLVKVAYMPLPRGVGIFETATVWLYEVLRLF